MQALKNILINSSVRGFKVRCISESVVVFFIVSRLFCSSGWAEQVEWREVGPGGGGAVRDFAFDPNNSDRVYLTSDMVGNFISDDAGDRWRWSSYGAATQMGGIAVDPESPDILYSVGPLGIFQSLDRAKHWKLLYSKGNGYKGVNNETFGSVKESIFGVPGQSVSVSQKGVVYVGTVVGDVIISRDKGKTFKRIATGGKSPVRNIVFANGRSVVAALSREGIYLSRNEGSTWENTLSPSDGDLLALSGDPVKNNILFALVGKHSIFTSIPDTARHFPGYLYQSADSGKTWELVHEFEKLPIRKDRHIMDISEEGTIIILTAHGPIRSIDGGSIWEDSILEGKKDDGFIYTGLKGKPVGPLSVFKDLRTEDRWFMTNTLAAFRSDDDGRTWRYKVRGLREQSYRFVRVNPDKPDIIIASDMDHGLIRSFDGGISWRDVVIINPFEECDQLRFSPADKSHRELYAFFVFPYPYIAKSTDAGNTWSVIKKWENKKKRSMNGFCLVSGQKIPAMYVGEANKGIWKSIDEGKSWERINKGLPKGEEMNYIQFLESDRRGYIYVGIASNKRRTGGIFKSQDGGENWSPINSGLPLFVRRGSFEIDPNNPDILWTAAGNSIYRSFNGGKNWEKRIGNMYSSAILVEPRNSDVIYVSSYTGGGIVKQYTAGIYKSVDGGNYFFKISGDLFRTIGSNYRVFDLEYGWRGPGGIWAAPDGGGLIYTITN
jgi:photosystem II stability/assembly factor-like uncharacterized protein